MESCNIDLQKLLRLPSYCIKESFLSLEIEYTCQTDRIQCTKFTYLINFQKNALVII